MPINHIAPCGDSIMSLLFNDASIKMASKPVKKRKENPAWCAGEGKQIKGNIGEEKRTVDSVKFEFCGEIKIKRCEGKERGMGVG